MMLSDLVEFLMNEVNAWDADATGWVAMREFFEDADDVDNCANKELIALVDNRVSLINIRREQLMNLLYQISGLEEVAA